MAFDYSSLPVVKHLRSLDIGLKTMGICLLQQYKIQVSLKSAS